jgi:hypothetical protein
MSDGPEVDVNYDPGRSSKGNSFGLSFWVILTSLLLFMFVVIFAIILNLGREAESLSRQVASLNEQKLKLQGENQALLVENRMLRQKLKLPRKQNPKNSHF